MGDSSVDPDLLRYISAALEMRDQGIDPPLEEICEGRTHLVPEVARAVSLSHRLPRLQDDTPNHDGFLGALVGSRYRLIERIGAGSMGVIYRGHDSELDRPVAVKVLRADILSGEEAAARFAREAEVLAAVRHPGVVTVFDRGDADGCGFLVMELLDGLPLSELLDECKRRASGSVTLESDVLPGQLGPHATTESSYLRTVVAWIAQLASGLAAAHAAGVYHRDVKPSNVYVRRDGRAALIDFGIAARDDHETLMRGRGALGTPAYMAPEALDVNTPAGPGLDVYGLCATLYHALTLRAPYDGTPSQVLSTLARSEPTPAHRLRPGLPRDLQAVLDRGMARHPNDRYRSAQELEADLRAFLDHRPVSARPVTALGRAWRRLRRSPIFWTLATLLLVATLVRLTMAWRAHDHAQRVEAHAQLATRLLPSLTLWAPDSRRIEDATLRGAVFAQLDRLVELGIEPIAFRNLRAALRLDHGQARAAAGDMRVVASLVASPFSARLAHSFDQLSVGAQGAGELDLTQLPEPSAAQDHFLAAYHRLRVERSLSALHAARDWLRDPRLAQDAAAQELSLLVEFALASAGSTREERLPAHRSLHERAVRIEEALGRRSATTAHIISGALSGQERYAEAREVAHAGLALAPRAHGLHANLGVAARRVGSFDESKWACLAAIEIRPSSLNPYLTLFRVHLSCEEFDEAHELMARAPLGDTPAGDRRRVRYEGEIETERALSALRQGERELARDHAYDALVRFEEAGLTPQSTLQQVVCRALVDEDQQQATTAILRMLENEPTNWPRMTTLINILPDELGSLATSSLRDTLQALAKHLAPMVQSTSD